MQNNSQSQNNNKYSRLNSEPSHEQDNSNHQRPARHVANLTQNAAAFPNAPPFPGANAFAQSSSSSSSSSSAAAYFSSNQDFLNSSQTEMSWLNSSLSLPAEQRYQALNDMVSRIVEDDMLMNSGNSSSLNFSFRNFQHALSSYPQNSMEKQAFNRQFSNSSNLSRQNSNETSKITADPAKLYFNETHANGKGNHQAPKFTPSSNNQPGPSPYTNNSMNQTTKQQPSPPFIPQQQAFQFSSPNAWQPGFGLNEENKGASAFAMNKDYNFSGVGPPPPPPMAAQNNLMNPLYQLHLMQMQQKNTKIFSPNDAFNKFLVPQLIQHNYKPNLNSNHDLNEFNRGNNSNQPGKARNAGPTPSMAVPIATNNYEQQSEISNMPHPPPFYPPPNESIFNMPLAFPTSVAHHFATLSPDQQNYLLQQQQQLLMYLAINDAPTNSWNRMPSGPFNTGMFQALPKNTKQFQGFGFKPPNDDYSKKSTINTAAANVSPSPTSPTGSTIGSAKHHGKHRKGHNFAHPLESQPGQYGMNPNFAPRGGYGHEPHDDMSMLMGQPNFNFSQFNMIPRHVLDQLPHPFNVNMEDINMKNLVKQTYRQHRRTGPANELHIRLEECLYQLKFLDTERKKIETDLSNYNLNRPNRKISSNSKLAKLFVSPSAKRLPINPSRVDRLIVDSYRESTKTIGLLASIAQLDDAFFIQHENSCIEKWSEAIEMVQRKRNDELVNNINRQKIGQPVTNDAEVVALASSIHDLAKQTAKIRTLLWSLGTVMLEMHLAKDAIFSASDSERTRIKELGSSPDLLVKNLKIKSDLVEA